VDEKYLLGFLFGLLLCALGVACFVGYSRVRADQAATSEQLDRIESKLEAEVPVDTGTQV
jgi:hypothetical protein